MKQQSGFTLIELIVVIVILGILAAVAIPKFSDLGADARIAKMNAAVAALQTGYSLFHAQWLVKGSPGNVAGAGTITMDGVNIPYILGYPDVGGDGSTQAATTAASSGIVLAAGGLASYDMAGTAPTTTVLTIDADTTHTACKITYTESVASAAPVIDISNLTAANCK